MPPPGKKKAACRKARDARDAVLEKTSNKRTKNAGAL
jgi:hypothetical protein